MERKLPVQYPGAIYHVMNRGDQREPVFNADRHRWVETLGLCCAKIEQDLERRCETDAVKVKMTARLRTESVMTMD